MDRDERHSVVFVEFGGVRRGKAGALFVEPGREVVSQSQSPEERVRRALIAQVQEGPESSMSAVYSRREVAKLFAVSEGRLRYWEQSGFIVPSGYDGKKRCYTFADLVAVRTAVELLSKGVSLQRTRKMVAQLERLLPTATHPLTQLRIAADEEQVTVCADGRRFEPTTGQLLLDFTVESLREQVVASLPRRREAVERRTAYEWYLRGQSLDESPDTAEEAEYAYHQALQRDPELTGAYVNLGNLRFRAGAAADARALYEKALELDPEHPEALYNLGFLEYEEGKPHEAARLFFRVTQLDPDFADACFNLAVCLETVGNHAEAVLYWRRYLSLDPDGPWAQEARRHLVRD